MMQVCLSTAPLYSFVLEQQVTTFFFIWKWNLINVATSQNLWHSIRHTKATLITWLNLLIIYWSLMLLVKIRYQNNSACSESNAVQRSRSKSMISKKRASAQIPIEEHCHFRWKQTQGSGHSARQVSLMLGTHFWIATYHNQNLHQKTVASKARSNSNV